MSGINLWAPVSFRISTCQAQPAEGRSPNQSRARMTASCEISLRLGSCLFYFMTTFFYTYILDDFIMSYYVWSFFGNGITLSHYYNFLYIMDTLFLCLIVGRYGYARLVTSCSCFIILSFIVENTRRPRPGAWHGLSQLGRLFMYLFIYLSTLYIISSMHLVPFVLCLVSCVTYCWPCRRPSTPVL